MLPLWPVSPCRPEVRALTGLMALDHEGEHLSRLAAALSISAKIGCSAHRLLDWVKRADAVQAKRDALLLPEIKRVHKAQFEVESLSRSDGII
jgi:transposase